VGFFDGFFDVGKNIQNAGTNLSNAWKDAGRGEVGKWAGGLGQSAYNIAVAPARAISTGQYGKQLAVVTGSGANLVSGGTLDYAAHSSGLQRMLNSDEIIGKNLAAITRVASAGGRGDAVSNADRNLAWQGGVKLGATAAAAYGGYSLYSYLAAPSSVEASSAIVADSYLPSEAALAQGVAPSAELSAAGEEAALATESAEAIETAPAISAEATGAAAAGGTTTAAEGGWWSSVYGAGGSTLKTAGAVAIGAKLLGKEGGAAAQLLGGGSDPGQGGDFWGAVNNLIDGTKNRAPGGLTISPDVFGTGAGSGTGAVPAAAKSAAPVAMLAVAAVGIFFVAKKAKVI
jgi:hypothetical protein